MIARNHRETMEEIKYVLTFVEPLLANGYKTWPLSKDRRTVIGVTDLPGEIEFEWLN